MNKTKNKILLAGIELFNEKGISNVKRQEIAKKAGISLSNLNYNFKDKKDLIVSIFDYMGEQLEQKVYGKRMLILDGKGMEIIKNFFEFEQEFRFFYLDTYNIMQSFPELTEVIQEQIQQAILVIKNLNFLAIGKGHLKPEPKNQVGLYNQLAKQIWMSSHFHFAQMKIIGATGNPILKGLEATYLLIRPYLTSEGIAVYQEFIKPKEKSEQD